MATVGNVSSMKLKTTDNGGNLIETTITTSRLFVNPNATYENVDTLARALAGLSRNTYDDTDLITIISVNEKMAEE